MSSPIKYKSAVQVPTLILTKTGQGTGKLSCAATGKDIVVVVDETDGTFNKDKKNGAILTPKAIVGMKIRFADQSINVNKVENTQNIPNAENDFYYPTRTTQTDDTKVSFSGTKVV